MEGLQGIGHPESRRAFHSADRSESLPAPARSPSLRFRNLLKTQRGEDEWTLSVAVVAWGLQHKRDRRAQVKPREQAEDKRPAIKRQIIFAKQTLP